MPRRRRASHGTVSSLSLAAWTERDGEGVCERERVRVRERVCVKERERERVMSAIPANFASSCGLSREQAYERERESVCVCV